MHENLVSQYDSVSMQDSLRRAAQRIRFLQQCLARLAELQLDENGIEGLRMLVDDIYKDLNYCVNSIDEKSFNHGG